MVGISWHKKKGNTKTQHFLVLLLLLLLLLIFPVFCTPDFNLRSQITVDKKEDLYPHGTTHNTTSLSFLLLVVPRK